MLGSSNPVAGPYFNFTVPEPTGVVGVARAATSRRSRARLAGRAGARRRQRDGRVASETHPLAAVELAEALATSDVPGGVVNILTGLRVGARARCWPAHMDVNAIDLTGADGGVDELERLAADNVKRVVRGASRRPEPVGDRGLPGAEDRLAPDRSLSRA